MSPIVTHKLRNDISVLEGSGGNIAVLTGPDGKLLIDAGIGVHCKQFSMPRFGVYPNSIHWRKTACRGVETRF